MTREQEIEKALADLVAFERAPRLYGDTYRCEFGGRSVDINTTRAELVRDAEHALRPVR